MRFSPSVVVWLSVFLSATAQAATAEEQKHFLWKMEPGSSTVYLLGSIHAADHSLYPLPSVIEKAFEQSQYLVMELDLSQVQSLQSQQVVLSQALLEEGSLPDLFSKTEYTRLNVELRHYGLSLDQFAPFKPWFVSLTLLQEGLRKLGFNPENGIDWYFHQRAQGRKAVLELESLEEQVAVLAGWDIEKQKLMLRYTLHEMESLEKYFDSILASWRAGDAAGLERRLFAPQQKDPQMTVVYHRIFRDRNYAMVDRIKRMFTQRPGTYFVVVGAGHMVGSEGLVELFRREGYPVEQL
jgi:uncharacterized protein YbaP (TraB family)